MLFRSAFLASADGAAYAPVLASRRTERAYVAPPHRGEQYRQTQVDYLFAPPTGTRHVKVVWAADMALDRVEILHPGR